MSISQLELRSYNSSFNSSFYLEVDSFEIGTIFSSSVNASLFLNSNQTSFISEIIASSQLNNWNQLTINCSSNLQILIKNLISINQTAILDLYCNIIFPNITLMNFGNLYIRNPSTSIPYLNVTGQSSICN